MYAPRDMATMALLYPLDSCCDRVIALNLNVVLLLLNLTHLELGSHCRTLTTYMSLLSRLTGRNLESETERLISLPVALLEKLRIPNELQNFYVSSCFGLFCRRSLVMNAVSNR